MLVPLHARTSLTPQSTYHYQTPRQHTAVHCTQCELADVFNRNCGEDVFAANLSRENQITSEQRNRLGAVTAEVT